MTRNVKKKLLFLNLTFKKLQNILLGPIVMPKMKRIRLISYEKIELKSIAQIYMYRYST